MSYGYTRTSRSSNAGCLLIGLFAVVVVAVLAFVGYNYEYGTEKNVTFTISSTSASSDNNTMVYKVFTTDGTVYEISDAWFHGDTDSSNTYAKLSAAGHGSTWNCPVYGFRNTLLSSYQDILDGCKQIQK